MSLILYALIYEFTYLHSLLQFQLQFHSISLSLCHITKHFKTTFFFLNIFVKIIITPVNQKDYQIVIKNARLSIYSMFNLI